MPSLPAKEPQNLSQGVRLQVKRAWGPSRVYWLPVRCWGSPDPARWAVASLVVLILRVPILVRKQPAKGQEPLVKERCPTASMRMRQLQTPGCVPWRLIPRWLFTRPGRTLPTAHCSQQGSSRKTPLEELARQLWAPWSRSQCNGEQEGYGTLQAGPW